MEVGFAGTVFIFLTIASGFCFYTYELGDFPYVFSVFYEVVQGTVKGALIFEAVTSFAFGASI